MAAKKETDAKALERLEDAEALPANQLHAAEANMRNTEEANERSAQPAEFDPPETVAELGGGAGALPDTLEPAAANARKTKRVSELQAKASASDDPNGVYRDELYRLAKKVGPRKSLEIVSRYGVDDPEDVPQSQVMDAIDAFDQALYDVEVANKNAKLAE